MKITTNNKPRDLIMFMDLTEKEKKDFDYIEGDEQFDPRLFRYKGNVYDAGDMMRVTELFNGWDAYQSDTFFSGILIKYADSRLETVIVAHYYC